MPLRLRSQTIGGLNLFSDAPGAMSQDDQRGSLALVASSNESTRLLEIFQLKTNEGPCLDCGRTATAVNEPSQVTPNAIQRPLTTIPPRAISWR